MILEVTTEPNPILRQKTAEVLIEEIASPEFQKLIDDMIQTMYASKGIGIAGPQVSASKRVIIVETATKPDQQKPVAFINPEIISKSWRTVMSEEGCLSVPGVFGIVKRFRGVKIKALDRDGKPVTIRNNHLVSVILQHEIDHLNGVLFIDKAEKVQPITDSDPRI